MIRRRALAATAMAIVMLSVPSSARADNCSGLSDCSTGIKIAAAVLAIGVVLAVGWAVAGVVAAEAAGAAALEAAAAESLAAEATAVEAVATEAAAGDIATAGEVAMGDAVEGEAAVGEVTEGEAVEAEAGESEAGAQIESKFEPKIERQMGKRGWTKESVDDTIRNPDRTVATRDTRWRADGTRSDDPATAYINEDGSYVVRNDTNGSIVQVSDRFDPGWKSKW
jgi:Colicin E5 ribonuclease domain